jgi:hypothetical protein
MDPATRRRMDEAAVNTSAIVGWFERVAETRHGEAAIVVAVRAMLAAQQGHLIFVGLPYSKFDTISFEHQLRCGRADIVMFHLDGTATVVEVKDGSQGWRNVVAGIGQVGFYAAQVSGVKSVRRALMWGGLSQDDSVLVATACREAGVVPLLAPSRTVVLLAGMEASILALMAAEGDLGAG